MWLAKAAISYSVPSTADLIITCRIPPDRIDAIRARFLRGAPGLVPLEIELVSDGGACRVRNADRFRVAVELLAAASSGRAPQQALHAPGQSVRPV
jgi:hypothetical protein